MEALDARRAARQPFFSLSPERTARKVHVLAAFVDIRGFSQFVKLQEARSDTLTAILELFFTSLSEAHRDACRNIQDDSAFDKKLQDFAASAWCKTQGDGGIIVWEYPESPNESAAKSVRAGCGLFAIDFVRYIQDYFYCRLGELINDTASVSNLRDIEIGIGLACGDALRLEGFCSRLDYAGTPLNVAARLQHLARPRGLVCELAVSPKALIERHRFQEGRIDEETIHGIGVVTIWASHTSGGVEDEVTTLYRRRARNTSSFSEAMKTAQPSIERFPAHKPPQIPLTLADTESIFDIRRKYEAQFVSDLCDRVKSENDDLTGEQLRMILKPQVHGADFHASIAELSSATDGLDRSAFARWAYEVTQSDGASNPRDLALRSAILEAVCNGDCDVAVNNIHHMLRSLSGDVLNALLVRAKNPDLIAQALTEAPRSNLSTGPGAAKVSVLMEDTLPQEPPALGR